MKAQCIKTCYIRDRYCEEGKVYDLPDDFPMKYFINLEKPVEVEVVTEVTDTITATSNIEAEIIHADENTVKESIEVAKPKTSKPRRKRVTKKKQVK